MPTNGHANGSEDDGSISPKGRFIRIEESLARIEDALDVKADASDMRVLVGRVSALELTQSNVVAVAEAVRAVADSRYRFFAFVVGLVTVANVGLSFFRPVLAP